MAVGRPTKLDDLRAKRITDALKAGHSFVAAARAGGIDEGTLHDWRKRGAAGEPEYSGFYQRVESACQAAEDRCVAVLKKALESSDLKLATDTAWKWLARRRPTEWGETKGEQKSELEVGTSEIGGEDLAVLDSLRAAVLSKRTGT